MLGRAHVGSSPLSRGRLVSIGLGVALLCLILAEVFYQVANTSGGADRRSASIWAAAVAPVLAESSGLAVPLHALRQLNGLADRLALQSALSQLQDSSTQELAELNGLAIPPSSPAAQHLLASTLSLRAQGLARLSGAINAVIGPSPPPQGRVGAVGAVVLAGSELQHADRTGKAFLKLVGPLDPVLRADFSSWISTPAAWSARPVGNFIDQLASTASYRAHYALKLIALSLDPAPLRISGLPTTTTTSSTTTSTLITSTTSATQASGVSGASGFIVPPSTLRVVPSTIIPTPTTLQIPPGSATSVLGPTASVSVVAVIGNTGNISESSIVLTSTLIGLPPPKVKAPAPRSGSATIALLAPSASRYVRLPPMSSSSKVTSYRVVLRISAPHVAPVSTSVSIRLGS